MYTEQQGSDGDSTAGTGQLTGTGMAILMRLMKAMCDVADEADRLKNAANALLPYGKQLREFQRIALSGEHSEEDLLDLFTQLVADFSPLGGLSFRSMLDQISSDYPWNSVSAELDEVSYTWSTLVEHVLGSKARRSL